MAQKINQKQRDSKFYIGVIPGSTFGTTGNKAITGVGFKPKLVRFTTIASSSGAFGQHGTGAMTTSNQFYNTIYVNGSGGAARLGGTDACISFLTGSGPSVGLKAAYVSMEDDGFIVNVSSAHSAFDIAYEAYG